ncbi:hypothetical protein GLOIN_2v1474312 [Rhizophagus clarus]|uniref:C2H2-type domain-containing protein n=1 Tax=Rhizophagus clarus TaxID=94130 RepID=A0A8H3QDD3_9GLOM|nr:hypothetical protein GLOIN_2v1474312 [Rhizophagus clarus]
MRLILSDMTFKCCLCQKIFSLRKQLLSHERVKHRNNKTIPHRHLLSQPSVEQLISYQDAFIILIKKHLGFNRHSQILNYEHWNCRQDPKTNTTGYVLFANYEGIYEVTFSWAQTELVENDRIFQCGTVTCKFTTDSGEFVDENGIMSN